MSYDANRSTVGPCGVLCGGVEEIARPFARWLAERLGVGAVRIDALERPAHGGLSAETILLECDWGAGPRGLVVRLPPAGAGLFPTYDLRAQTRVMDALRAHSRIPVPVVLWFEDDPTVLGRPFAVMERVEGRIPSDNPGYHFEGWVQELPAAQQACLLDESLATLAAVHHVDWAAAGLGFLPGIGLDHELASWREYLAWATDASPIPVIDATYEWCVAHRPRDEPDAALVWGDARLGNLVFGDDLSVRAVLDWEMATLGPPELDLGWYLFLERTALQFADQLPGFPDRAGTIQRYERHLGRPVRDIDWYEVWGGLRSAAIMIRVGAQLHELGLVPATFSRDNPVTRLLAALIA